MSDAYEIVWFRGFKFDRMTAQALAKMETKLGYKLTIWQGSYSTSVGASAGTHAGGGAVDLAPYDWSRKVRVGREVGFAMWHRQTWEGPWDEHVHGVLNGNAKLSPSASRQVTSYKNGRNGLASNLKDTYAWRPSPIPVYHYIVDAYVGISLSALKVDFLHVLGGGKNKATYRGKVIQRRLNKKLGGADLKVDGVIGPKTLDAWGRWEAKIGVVGRPRVPDSNSLKKLLKYSIYFMKA